MYRWYRGPDAYRLRKDDGKSNEMSSAEVADIPDKNGSASLPPHSESSPLEAVHRLGERINGPVRISDNTASAMLREYEQQGTEVNASYELRLQGGRQVRGVHAHRISLVDTHPEGSRPN